MVISRWNIKQVVARLTVKYEAGRLDFKPDCPLELLQKQESVMNQYLTVLEARALIENVTL